MFQKLKKKPTPKSIENLRDPNRQSYNQVEDFTLPDINSHSKDSYQNNVDTERLGFPERNISVLVSDFTNVPRPLGHLEKKKERKRLCLQSMV